jgi:hypothetical protein
MLGSPLPIRNTHDHPEGSGLRSIKRLARRVEWPTWNGCFIQLMASMRNSASSQNAVDQLFQFSPMLHATLRVVEPLIFLPLRLTCNLADTSPSWVPVLGQCPHPGAKFAD